MADVRGGKASHMSDEDPQDIAEEYDEDVLGQEEPVLSDELPADQDPLDDPRGLPFADADVTDESLADRAARELPETWETDDAGDDLLDEVDDDVTSS
jgi:hypothetical protein